jgi:hypothetical protein
MPSNQQGVILARDLPLGGRGVYVASSIEDQSIRDYYILYMEGACTGDTMEIFYFIFDTMEIVLLVGLGCMGQQISPPPF